MFKRFFGLSQESEPDPPGELFTDQSAAPEPRQNTKMAPRKGRKKQRQDHVAQADNSPEPIAADGSMSDAAAQAAAVQAQQLASQSLNTAPDASMGNNFNLFDQPNMAGAKVMPSARAIQGTSRDEESQAMTTQATDRLLQLANATQALPALSDGRRMLAPAQSENDASYMEVDPAAAEFLQGRDGAFETIDPAMEETPQAPVSKKRKRAAGDKGKASAKRQQTGPILQDLQDPNATEGDYPSSGPFTAAEKAIVERFAESFRNSNNLDAEVLNDLVQNKDRKMGDITRSFWTEIYQILPNRDNKAMQRHVRRRFHNYTVRGKWTAEDDEALKQTYDEKPNQWTHIGRVLHRMPEDCRDRWRNYVVCGTSRRTDQWDESEEQRLSEAVNECLMIIKEDARAKAREERLAFREDQDWESLLNFNIVSEKLDHTRSRIQCLQHWKAMGLREAEGRVKRRMRQPRGQSGTARTPRSAMNGKKGETPRIRFKKMLPGDKHTILQEILETDVHDEDKVNWTLLAQRSTLGLWSDKDRKFVWTKAKKTMDFSSDNFRERVGEAMNYYEQNFPNDLDKFYDGSEDATSSRPAGGGASADMDEDAIHAEPESADEKIDPQLEANAEPEPARKAKKQGRGPGRKPRKSTKNFKSSDRIEDDAVDDALNEPEQQAAPTANMTGMSSFPSNPYTTISDTVSRVYGKKRGRQEPAPEGQVDAEAEPELPPNGADVDED